MVVNKACVCDVLTNNASQNDEAKTEPHFANKITNQGQSRTERK